MKHSKLPVNVTPIGLHLCSDARKITCSFYQKITINNEHISFDQGFCAYKFRKNQNLTPEFCRMKENNT